MIDEPDHSLIKQMKRIIESESNCRYLLGEIFATMKLPNNQPHIPAGLKAVFDSFERKFKSYDIP